MLKKDVNIDFGLGFGFSAQLNTVLLCVTLKALYATH